MLYTLNYPGLTFDRPIVSCEPGSVDGEKLSEIHTRLRLNWEWAWRTTIDGDAAKALRMLDEPSS